METKISMFINKIVVIVVIVTFLNFILDLVLNVSSGLNYYAWHAVYNLLVFTLLGYYILHSSQSGIRLSLAVFAIYLIIGNLNLIVEAIIFNLVSIETALIPIPRDLIMTLFISSVLVYVLGKWESKTEIIEYQRRTVLGWVWRIAVGDFLYLVFYIAAGLTLITLYPELMEFYNEKTPPPPEIIFGTQLIRGLVFVFVAILVCRTVKLTELKKATLIGLVFSILGGIAPLILPNEVMPLNLRMGHIFEVGISNFLYGFLLGYLLSQKMILGKISG